jgi:hypothetical protein
MNATHAAQLAAAQVVSVAGYASPVMVPMKRALWAAYHARLAFFLAATWAMNSICTPMPGHATSNQELERY